MQELIEAVKGWPAIVQGALGSALFWLVLLLGQKAASSAANRYSHLSKKARRTWLINERARCLASMAKTNESFATFATIILYRASRLFLKAIMWLVMGLFGESLLSGLGVVGYVGCLYYLFKTYQVVAPMSDESHNEQRLEALSDELQRLEG